mmetsp:Transcript_39801/g.83172  ORF Transcript_39801/g.83172 Transcript_39801/m.83172 type:complete len:100 (+) Transcript_39801:167-466(+)
MSVISVLGLWVGFRVELMWPLARNAMMLTALADPSITELDYPLPFLSARQTTAIWYDFYEHARDLLHSLDLMQPRAFPYYSSLPSMGFEYLPKTCSVKS